MRVRCPAGLGGSSNWGTGVFGVWERGLGFGERGLGLGFGFWGVWVWDLELGFLEVWVWDLGFMVNSLGFGI